MKKIIDTINSSEFFWILDIINKRIPSTRNKIAKNISILV